MIGIIVQDIMNAIWDYGLYALIFAGLITSSVLFLIIIYKYDSNKTRDFLIKNQHLIIIGYIFCVYIFLLVSITLLSRPQGSRVGIDLIPFSTFSPNLLDSRYPIENILLFIPFGFIVPNLWAPFRKAYLCLGTGLTFSIGIEIIQLITKRGFFQLDDMLTNFAGTIIGFVINFILMIACHIAKKYLGKIPRT